MYEADKAIRDRMWAELRGQARPELKRGDPASRSPACLAPESGSGTGGSLGFLYSWPFGEAKRPGSQ